MALEKTFESLLDCKEIKPVNPKGNQSWIFIGRTDAETKTPIPWSPDANNWLIRKNPDAWNDWRQEEKGTTKDETVGWHHWLSGHESEQAPGVMGREAWHAEVHGVPKSKTWLSDRTEMKWWEWQLYKQIVCPDNTVQVKLETYYFFRGAKKEST